MLKRFSVCIFLLSGLMAHAFAADQEQNVCKGDPDKWQQLFNGKDLTGWHHVGPGGDTGCGVVCIADSTACSAGLGSV